MNAAPKAVVDASVALQWLLQDEPLADEAGRLLDAFISRQIEIAAPAFIRYEVANTLEQAARRHRIPPETVQVAFNFLLSLNIIARDDGDSVVKEALHIARQTGATVYDSMYAAYARSVGFDFVTADAALARQLASYPVATHLLGEIDSLL